ncbi:MAG: thiamine pyrophosphate-binding protein [Betaproteobacteria bacterium]|nr:thiamine pyrophosphate-binding protein [Betaproteobacteria bacterium]MSQ88663.1 thiamine pyrophosphate-binding protein [Betaproteobacteria bacterium]
MKADLPDASAGLLSRHGGQILAAALAGHGARVAFGVPGESFLPVLDGLHDLKDRLKFVICRQEGGAAYMADAWAKLTGEPGVLFVTRGPGATNGSVGVHTAFQDSTPMIVFVGQVGNDCAERDAFQEIDYRRMYGPLTKWVAQIDRAERIPEYVSHAFHTATAGRPGPVLLALPEDMLFSQAVVADAPRFRRARAAPAPADMQELERLLAGAKRPFVLIGGGGWTRQASDGLRAWVEATGIPVGCGFRCQDYFDNRHPSYAGDVGIGVNPKLAQRVRDADLLLVIGERLGEITTGAYTLFDVPAPKQTLVHVQAGAEELGRVYQAALPINSNYEEFVFALSAIKTNNNEWRNQTRSAREDYLAWNQPLPMPGALHYGEVIAWLSQNLPEDAIVTNGAGNFASWLHRHFQYKGWRTQLAPTSGSMGYGVPAAVAAKIEAPGRTVIAIAGDGDFLMNGQEFATAMQYGAAIIVLVVNNGMYGTIRMHQEREYPGRVSGTELVNPDFAAYARAFGGHGETVERSADFAPAFQRAVASGKPAIIELRIDPEAITPSATLSGLRAAALAKK